LGIDLLSGSTPPDGQLLAAPIWAQPVPVSFRALISSVSDPEMRQTILAQCRRRASGWARRCGRRAARCANSNLDCIGDRAVSLPVGLRRCLLRRSLVLG
jgi:hypothetical protein